MDGSGDGPADGVAGGRAWRAGTLSLQRAYLNLQLVAQSLSMH